VSILVDKCLTEPKALMRISGSAGALACKAAPESTLFLYLNLLNALFALPAHVRARAPALPLIRGSNISGFESENRPG